MTGPPPKKNLEGNSKMAAGRHGVDLMYLGLFLFFLNPIICNIVPFAINAR